MTRRRCEPSYPKPLPPFLLSQLRENAARLRQAPILILAWRGSTTTLDWVNDAAVTPTLCTPPPALCPLSEHPNLALLPNPWPNPGPNPGPNPVPSPGPSPNSHARPLLAASRWSSETKQIRAHGAFVNLVENTFSLHEDEIVALALKKRKGYKPVTRAFITGHSLAGGMANVAHLFVKAGAKKADSPWAELAGKVTWLACTFASPVTIVRLYGPDNIPPLIVDLDASSYDVVYGCDAVPRLSFLKYVGALLEIAAPEIAKAEGEAGAIKKIEEKFGFKFPSFLKGLVGVAIKHNPIGDLDDGLDNLAHYAVKFLKKTGLTELMLQYSHIGTIYPPACTWIRSF